MSYKLIYADPPWQYQNKISNGAAANHYPTMKLEDLKRLPVWSIAADDAVLCMWFTGNHVDEARELAKAWGFDVRTMKGFTWVKLNELAQQRIEKALREQEIHDIYDWYNLLNAEIVMNGGNYTRANSEDMLIAVRGAGLERASAGVKQVIVSSRDEHSAKPAEARSRLEQLYGDVSRIELFSRGDAPGWHHWGDDCPFPDIELVPATFNPLPNSRASLVKAQSGHYQPVTPSPLWIGIDPAAGDDQTVHRRIEVTRQMVELAGTGKRKPIVLGFGVDVPMKYRPIITFTPAERAYMASLVSRGIVTMTGVDPDDDDDDDDMGLVMKNAGADL